MTLLLLAACIKPTPPGPSPAEQRERLHALVTAPHSDGAPARVEIAVQAGSVTDPAGAEGLSWLTAQTLLLGGSGADSPSRMDQRLYAMGATVDVHVDKELVRFSGSAPQDQADALGQLMVSLLTQPRWDSNTFGTLKAQALAWTQAPPSPGPLALALWVNTGHPYGHAEWGRRGSLEGITLQQAQLHHRDTYLRSGVTVGISSPGEDTLAAILEQGLQELAVGRSPLPPPHLRQTPSTPALLVVHDAAPPSVQLGLPLQPTRADAEWPALELALRGLASEHPEWGMRLDAPPERRQATLVLEPTDPDPRQVRAVIAQLQEALRSGLTQQALDGGRAAHLAWAQECREDPQRSLVVAVGSAALDQPDPLLPPETVTLDQAQAALSRWVDPLALRVVVVSDDPDSVHGSLDEESDAPAVQARVPLSPSELLR